MTSNHQRPEGALTGKVAVITGAARGLGLAMAQAAIAAGAHVVLNDRNAEELAAVVATLNGQGKVASAAPFDVTDQASVVAGLEKVVADHHRIDILVNNAGNQLRKPFIDYTLEEWRSVLDVHLTGSFLVSQFVARRMIEQQSGSIIMIGSVAVQSVRGTITPYVAAKGAVTALARALAVELGPQGVRCNVIAPGFYETEFNRAMLDNPEFYQTLAARVPLKRWGKPEDLAPAMVFLASDAARYVNGQTLAVDGGTLAAL